ncbi:hypothetical protein [Capnocytophaga granulosa]|uniref:hypothetical protein n=1 Tax=Capnocytophaga granulosa TaxID=45242 RepID=UPI003857AFA2
MGILEQLHRINLSKFFFDVPLYTKVSVQDTLDIEKLEEITNISLLVDDVEGYNPIRKVESTFEILGESNTVKASLFIEKGGYRTIYIRCKRYEDIFTFSIFYNVEEKYLIKIGQYPSIADFHIYEIKQYDKLLPNEVLKEFTKAIGLAANGVGIGSFVYLRRIFENLILESFEEAKQEGKVKDEAFNKLRMDEKIEFLKDYLPPFLVKNKSIYSILSKGIHELDENTCLEYFETMKLGIQIILDQKLERKKQKEKEEEAMKNIQQLKKEIKQQTF